MGKMFVVFAVYPEDVEDIPHIEKALRELKEGEFREVKKEPVAFGMELIKAAYLLPDKVEGVLEALEGAIKAISGVSNEEVSGMTLI